MPDLTQPDHLPNLRPDREPPHPSWLPRQRRGTTPQMIGRYPDFDVFEASATWDPATAAVVAERMAMSSRQLEFFSEAEAAAARVLCDIVMAQDGEPRVPVVEMIDDKLAAGRLDGYQYDDMPDDRDTWHLVLAGLDHLAGARYSQPSLAQADPETAHGIVEAFAKAEVGGGPWEQLDAKRAWSVCLRMILSAFYAHPWAWNEIGFPGPAYPRGYMRLGPTGVREPFERPGATSEDPVRLASELQG